MEYPDKELLLISDEEFWKNISIKHTNKGGVYKIIAVKAGERVSINIFLGTDASGVLYIGKARSFLSRVVNLKKTLSPNYNSSAHICGRRYKANHNIAKRFPYDVLHVELLQTDNPDQLERELLVEYARIYGEVPPLNAI